MNQKDKEFLKELQHEMNTQDTVCQADPRFWVVMETSREYGVSDDYCDGRVLVLEDCEYETMDELYEFLKELINEGYTDYKIELKDSYIYIELRPFQ